MVCVFNSAWNWLTNNASNVIALCAFGATFWQAHISRVHNKLSVKPHLTLFIDNGQRGLEFNITLQNNGVGPALLTKFCINLNGHEIQNTFLEEKHQLIKNELFPEFDSQLSCFDIEDKDYMMSAGDKIVLIRFTFNVDRFPSINAINEARNKVKIQVEYESIYKEKFNLPE